MIKDFLDTIDISFESSCWDMTGGRLFGYIEALKLVSIRTVLFYISDRSGVRRLSKAYQDALKLVGV